LRNKLSLAFGLAVGYQIAQHFMARSFQIPTEAIISSVFEVYERGLTVEAWQRAEKFAPLKNWGGINPCVLVARIAVNAGAPHLATRLSVRAWRTDKSHPAAQLQYGYQLAERRGALAAWRVMRGWQASRHATEYEQAELFALRARVVADLRDFATAEQLLERAEALGSARPWIRLQRAHLLERQDRVEEALESSRAATAIHPFPFYRPAVQTTAHLLQLLDRDDDAIKLLTEAGAVLQSGPVAVQLYGLLSENGRWAEAEAALLRYVELSPLLEAGLKKWVAVQRARVAYYLGKRSAAANLARELDDDFHKNFAANLEAAPGSKECVQLEVSFVRQHFKTCAPATLAALGRFWKMPAEHLKLAEAMCYDGTPSWQQRDWAEENGWYVREFRVTHESVLALIGRGIPFAVSTVEATSAHMQAVAGFDRVRGTVLLRDPGQPYIAEFFAEVFFKRQRPFGPHGMVLLPMAERGRLDGVELPDGEMYDAFHCFSRCLPKHDRAGAAKILQTISESQGEHALVWEMRLSLAGYDANVSEQLRCLDKLLELFPDCAARQLRRLNCLQNTPRAERVEFLEQTCRAKEADPTLFIELARALGEDARRLPDATRWLKRALRFRPFDSNAIGLQADFLWDAGGFDEATELYRFAANLESYRENLFQSWFIACRRTRRTDEAMAMLEDRFKRFGALSEQPGLTLAWAWRELDQPKRAQVIYAEACRLRPDNGYLLLRAASLAARLGDRQETEKLLLAAKDKVRRNDWLRANAEIAESRLDATASLQAAREIVEIEPLALDAHGGVARSLAQLEGTTAALTHLKSACARFPHHYGLQRMLLDWNRDASTGEAESAARELLRIDPVDAWARRELAMILVQSGRHDDALREADEAAQIEPHNSYSFSVVGHVQQRLKRIPEARASFRRALELSVDNRNALHTLLELAPTDKERKDELAFIEAQLIKQVVTGDGLLAFRDLAEPVLAPETLLQSLQLAHRERPDLWHAWSALAAQLGHMNRLDDALAIARQASERFPHLPRLWLDLALAHQWRKEADAEIASARRAFETNPGWNRATLALSGALERSGKFDEARAVYERALQHSANDAQIHAHLAHLLWRQRQPDAAFAEVERALRLAPGYDWPWDLLREWATERGESDRAGKFARVLTQERPGEARVWLMLARTLPGADSMTERLTAVDRALGLNANVADTWDLKAELLCLAERFDEAVQATREGARVCTADVYILRGRHAWIEAQRHRLPEAVRLVREVLAENGSYVWGWNQLARWLIEQDALVDAAAALETLQRLRPHDSWVSRQLGLLNLKQGDRAAAQKSFAAAFQISPTDVHAAHNLFDLQLKSADLKGAAETLRVMQLHQPGAATQTTEIFLLLRRSEIKAANALLEQISSGADPDAWPVDAAADAYRRAGQGAKALKIFKRAIKAGACNPQVGAAAINLLAARRALFSAVWLFFRFKPGELQRRAAAPLVHGLASARSKTLLRWLLWRRRQTLRQDDEAWGKVGYALSHFNLQKQAAAWLSDWRSRCNVQPWMLFNLCLALRQNGLYPEATEVVRYAVQKWGHREGAADLRLFLAVEDALAGEVASAQEHLKRVSIRDTVAYDQDLLALARALVEFLQTPEVGRVKQFKSIRVQLAKRFTAGRMVNGMKDVRRTFRRTGKVFTEQGGGWRTKLWFGWKLNWQWLVLPPGLLMLVLFPPVLLGLLIWAALRNRQRK
jgi:tetratricopeptide (TPR) repeat protein